MSKERRLIGVMRIADRLGCGSATVRRKAGLQKGYERDPDFPTMLQHLGEWKMEEDELEAYIDALKSRHVA